MSQTIAYGIGGLLLMAGLWCVIMAMALLFDIHKRVRHIENEMDELRKPRRPDPEWKE